MKRILTYYKERYRLVILSVLPALLIWRPVGIVRAQTEAPSEGADPCEVRSEVSLGTVYVDIRNGFSVQPLPGSEPVSNSLLTLSHPEQDPCLVLPDLTGWEAVKKPASKELVRFVHHDEKGITCLSVCLLAVKKEMNTKEMVQERRGFWKQHPQQTDIIEEKIIILNDRQVGLIKVLWKGKKSIREVLVQSEKDRYFLLTLTTIDGPPQESRANDIRMEAIGKSFSILGKTEEDRRWEQAKKKGQLLLAHIKTDKIQDVLQPDLCYRLIRRGKDIGYVRIREQTARKGNTDPCHLKIEYEGYIQNHQDGEELAHLLGWLGTISRHNGAKKLPEGGILIQVEMLLEKSFKGETFFSSLLSEREANKGFREEGTWKGHQLTIKRYGPPTMTDKPLTEKLEVNSPVYLARSPGVLLPRLLERKVGEEYVFLTYYNQALCYFSLRVAGEENPEENTQAKKLIYLVGQAGAQGPIVETWVDEKGVMVKQRGGGITMEQVKLERIQQLWPKQIGKK